MTYTATLTKSLEYLPVGVVTVYTVKIFAEDGSLYDVQSSTDLKVVLKNTLAKFSKITIVVELSK